ncbi:hypothetical protein SY2F82_03070 [Streptomyces sp. Y2F8-2]|nr:hypothetical protein SY2F82_03070 [Streptomyces sp. Y2F8-2]
MPISRAYVRVSSQKAPQEPPFGTSDAASFVLVRVRPPWGGRDGADHPLGSLARGDDGVHGKV